MRPCAFLHPILAGLVLFAPDAGAACSAQRAGGAPLLLPGHTLVDVTIDGTPERMVLDTGDMGTRRFYLAYAYNALFVQRQQPIPLLDAHVAMAAPAPDRAPARSDIYQPSPALLDTVSPALLIVVSEPRLAHRRRQRAWTAAWG
jgi:hypothetical protein